MANPHGQGVMAVTARVGHPPSGSETARVVLGSAIGALTHPSPCHMVNVTTLGVARS